MKKLDELAKSHGTDKSSDCHDYCRIYEELFWRLRDSSVNLLEIGVFKGSSLRMWRDFFQCGSIVGIDNERESPVPASDERIQILSGDQADLNFLESVSKFGPFDIIIDDGSHVWSDIITSYEYLIHKLNPGGFYCIEDIHTSYNCSYRGQGQISTVNYFKNLVDNIQLFGVGGETRCHHKATIKWDEPETTHFNNRLIESIQFFPSLCVLRKKQ